MWFLSLVSAISMATFMMFSVDSGDGATAPVVEAHALRSDVVADRALIAMRAIQSKLPLDKAKFPSAVSGPLNIKQVSGTTVAALMPGGMTPPPGVTFFQQSQGDPALRVEAGALEYSRMISRFSRDLDRVEMGGKSYFVFRPPAKK